MRQFAHIFNVIDNSGDLDAARETAVDPGTWRHLKLEAVMFMDDGTRDVNNVVIGGRTLVSR